jgi:methionine-S-sulfoxide reductase
VVFAGGCFWGVQGVFQHVKGVSNAVSGYIGGSAANARYERVSSGQTGHAEAVKIDYDPRQVSYGQLMQVFFSVVHDPTQLNRQGRTTAASTARRSSATTPASRLPAAPTSPSSARPAATARRSSPSWSAASASTRPRATTRTT